MSCVDYENLIIFSGSEITQPLDKKMQKMETPGNSNPSNKKYGGGNITSLSMRGTEFI